MNGNNTVYKGYRLSARVDRLTGDNGGARSFKATITLTLPGAAPSSTNSYPVPQSTDGISAGTPTEAVHAALAYGRKVVDDMGFQGRNKREARGGI